jgi:hypothetical protein
MKKIIRLTESDLTRIVKRVIKENELKSFDGELIYLPGMRELDDITLTIIAKSDAEAFPTEDDTNREVYWNFVDKFEKGSSEIIDYIKFDGGRYTEREIKKMKKEIANFVSNPEKCVFVTTDNWLYLILKASDVYIVKYKGNLYEESEL